MRNNSKRYSTGTKKIKRPPNDRKRAFYEYFTTTEKNRKYRRKENRVTKKSKNRNNFSTKQ